MCEGSGAAEVRAGTMPSRSVSSAPLTISLIASRSSSLEPTVIVSWSRSMYWKAKPSMEASPKHLRAASASAPKDAAHEKRRISASKLILTLTVASAHPHVHINSLATAGTVPQQAAGQ
jgi:hypothetical protein